MIINQLCSSNPLWDSSQWSCLLMELFMQMWLASPDLHVCCKIIFVENLSHVLSDLLMDVSPRKQFVLVLCNEAHSWLNSNVYGGQFINKPWRIDSRCLVCLENNTPQVYECNLCTGTAAIKVFDQAAINLGSRSILPPPLRRHYCLDGWGHCSPLPWRSGWKYSL